MKPGIKTSEFWISVLVIVFGAWLVYLDKTETGVSMVTLVSGYWIGTRSGMKKNGGGSNP